MLDLQQDERKANQDSMDREKPAEPESDIPSRVAPRLNPPQIGMGHDHPGEDGKDIDHQMPLPDEPPSGKRILPQGMEEDDGQRGQPAQPVPTRHIAVSYRRKRHMVDG
jgi:hypothetical protein